MHARSNNTLQEIEAHTLTTHQVDKIGARYERARTDGARKRGMLRKRARLNASDRVCAGHSKRRPIC